MNAAGNRHGLFVADVKPTPVAEFRFTRDDKSSNRVLRIVPVDQPQIVVVGQESISLGDLAKLRPFPGRNVGDLIHVADVLNPPDRIPP